MKKDAASSKSAVAAPARHYKMHTLASLVPSITRPAFRKRSPATVTIMTDWADIVGPQLAACTMPRRLSAGMLTIGCSGPTAMELQHQATQLIDRINTYCGQQIVTKLRAVQDVSVFSPPPRRTTPIAPAPVAVDMPEGPLKEALGRLGASIAHRKTTRR